MSRGYLLLPAALIACDSHDAAVSIAVRVDSQVVSIGLEEGESAYLFDRIDRVFIDSDSQIIVVDGGSHQVRVFDLQGRHVRTFGGTGAGPGEFESVLGAWLLRDTLAIWDAVNRRVSYWTSTGVHLRDERVTTAFTPIPLGRFDSGSFLVLEATPHVRMPPGGVNDQPATVHVVNVSTSTDAVLGEVPWEPVAAGVSPLDNTRSSYVTQPYGMTTHFAVGPDFYYQASSSDSTVLRISEAGITEDVLILPGIRPRELSDADRQRWVENAVSEAAWQYQPGVRRFVSSLTLPDRYPTIDAMLLASNQYVWIKLFQFEGIGGSKWLVLVPDGDVAQEVELPSGFRPTMIGPAWIAGVATDTLGVERAVVYALSAGN